MSHLIAAIDLLGDARKALLAALKQARRATIPQLAETLNVTTEAVRQQLNHLQRDGWVTSDCGPGDDPEGRVPGRPAAEYCLSSRAEDLFPKDYATLAVTLFDELADAESTLATITDARVAKASPHSKKTSLADRIDQLQSIYFEDDPYTTVERSDRGYRLIERNCPYLGFAAQRPLFCSTTVSALRRLTGVEVVREQRFQDGDGRCVFHAYADAPLPASRLKRSFEIEPAKDFKPA
jgi:predicted ArsR family transcriptional regulator